MAGQSFAPQLCGRWRAAYLPRSDARPQDLSYSSIRWRHRAYIAVDCTLCRSLLNLQILRRLSFLQASDCSFAPQPHTPSRDTLTEIGKAKAYRIAREPAR